MSQNYREQIKQLLRNTRNVIKTLEEKNLN